eukprot:COSAG01_NODE_9439_length_2446_cov_29.363443_1_plen_51_part_10
MDPREEEVKRWQLRRKRRMRNHPKDFVAGKDSWPTLRTTKDKHAMAPCAQS